MQCTEERGGGPQGGGGRARPADAPPQGHQQPFSREPKDGSSTGTLAVGAGHMGDVRKFYGQISFFFLI